MYSFASGTILSAGTCSPSIPGTHPVSLNISLASSRRAIQSLVITLLMIYLSGVGDRGSCDRRSPNGALWNIARDRLHWLDVGRPDHLAPFLGFVGDEFPEFSGGHKCRLETHVEEAHLHLRIGKDCVDLVVEPVNNVGGRIFRGANTLLTARLVAGHKFVHGWDIGQHIQAGRGGHCEAAQLAVSDVLDRLSHCTE